LGGGGKRLLHKKVIPQEGGGDESQTNKRGLKSEELYCPVKDYRLKGGYSTAWFATDPSIRTKGGFDDGWKSGFTTRN